MNRTSPAGRFKKVKILKSHVFGQTIQKVKLMFYRE